MMTPLARQGYRDRPVGEVVAEDYSRAAVFKRHGIDFCCGGGRTVSEAATGAGVDLDLLERELGSAGATGSEAGADDPRQWDLDLLADYIEKRHHRYVRRTAPVLTQFCEKLVRVHGMRHPELIEIRDSVAELATEMDRHMNEEEQFLFPMAEELSGGPSTPRPEIVEVIGAMEHDHDHAGSLLRRVRELSDDYTPPVDACATYRATFALLDEFECDLHRHVHLENNILFPRMAELAAGAQPVA